MQNIIITKWIEPYVLLETLKKNFDIKDITFDGFTKNSSKEEMMKILSENPNKAFGLYMKNVNKFYVFTSSENICESDLFEIISIDDGDFSRFDDIDYPINCVDMAKAEAAILSV